MATLRSCVLVFGILALFCRRTESDGVTTNGASPQASQKVETRLLGSRLLANGTAEYVFAYPSGAFMHTRLKVGPTVVCWLVTRDNGDDTYTALCMDEVPQHIVKDSKFPLKLAVFEVHRPIGELMLEFPSEGGCNACVWNDPTTCTSKNPKIIPLPGTPVLAVDVDVIPNAAVFAPDQKHHFCTINDLRNGSGGRWRWSESSFAVRPGIQSKEWVNDTWQWHYPHCRLRYFEPKEALKHLERQGIRKILFFGDSLTRNTFFEMASFFSGQSAEPKKGSNLLRQFSQPVVFDDGKLQLYYASSWTLYPPEKTNLKRFTESNSTQECWALKPSRDRWSSMRVSQHNVGMDNLRQVLKEHPDIDLIIANLGLHHPFLWNGYENFQLELDAFTRMLKNNFKGRVIYRSYVSMSDVKIRIGQNNPRLEYYDAHTRKTVNEAGLPYIDVFPMSRRRQDRIFDNRYHVYPRNDYDHVYYEFPKTLVNEFNLLLLNAIIND